MTRPSTHIDPASLWEDINQYRAGSDEAGNRLLQVIRPAVHLDVARHLGDADADVEDVVQDSLMAALKFLRKEQGFEGNFVGLCVTIARNRCRDLLRVRRRRPQTEIESMSDWLADPSISAIDELADDQILQLLQDALNRISQDCRMLLQAIYIDELSTEAVRVMTGLGTPQGVFHRRSVCLDQVRKLLQRSLNFGSGSMRTSIKESTRRTGDEAP